MTIDRIALNDELARLADEHGAQLSDEALDNLTHHVADVLAVAQGNTPPQHLYDPTDTARKALAEAVSLASTIETITDRTDTLAYEKQREIGVKVLQGCINVATQARYNKSSASAEQQAELAEMVMQAEALRRTVGEVVFGIVATVVTDDPTDAEESSP